MIELVQPHAKQVREAGLLALLPIPDHGRRADGGGLRGGEGGGAAAVGLRNLTFFEFE